MKQFPLFILAFILVTILMTLHNNKPEETIKVEKTEPIQPNPEVIMKILNEYGDTFKAGDTIEIQQKGNDIQIKSIHPKSE